MIEDSSTKVRIRLLDVPVDAHGRLNHAEHARRGAHGSLVIRDAELLARLEELPLRQRIHDPVLWAETSRVPAGVITRHDDMTVTRLLDVPLHLEHIAVECPHPRAELRSVQQASLFARFARRWVTMSWPPREITAMEASLLGVGILVTAHHVAVPASDPVPGRADGWAWCLAEKIYQRVLNRTDVPGGQPCH